MKLLTATLAACAVIAGVMGANTALPQLQHIQSVYILPMGSGMDQYLANRITRDGLFQVVTDPQKADAVITDRLGEPLERKLDELYPPPKPITVAKPDKDKDSKNKGDQDKADKDKADKDKAADNKNDDQTTATIDNPIAATAGMPHPSSFGRGKGTIFLVDRRSRAVLWSTYNRPHDMRPDTLDKSAAQIIRRLKRDLTETKPAQAQ